MSICAKRRCEMSPRIVLKEPALMMTFLGSMFFLLTACGATGEIDVPELVPDETQLSIPPISAPSDQLNVLILGWDGVQQNHLRQLMAAGRMPNLQSVVDAGSIAELYVTHFTDTKCSTAKTATWSRPRASPITTRRRT
jgi:hypothetical protein